MSAPGPDETLDSALGGRLRLLQRKKGYRFSLDGLLLADFLSPAHGRAADLGTGSGVIALALALQNPGLQVEAVELQAGMAGLASRNVALNGLGEQVRVHQADLREPLAAVPRASFDLVAANPPYQALEESRVSPESERALARHEVAGRLEDFASAAAALLRPGGRFGLVYPADRLARVFGALAAERLTPARMRLVHAHANDPAELVLLEGELRGKGRLETLPPLVLHPPGARAYTDEALRILGEPPR